MHDIVYDFVQSLTNNECSIIDIEDVGNEIEVLGEKIRHVTLRLKLGEPLPPSNVYYNCKSLRTLSILFSSNPTTIDFNFILQLKCLSKLNLRDNDITKVPREIGDLIHMRHIDLPWNGGLSILPDNINKLYNLYTLRLCGCFSLEKLPDNMRKLISLKHLFVKYCHKLKYLPKGILRSKNSKTIDECALVCGGDDDTATLRLGDLKFLNLQGSLSIRLKWNVKDEREIEKAQLRDMKQLFHREINCEYDCYKNTTSTVEILNVLRPHENLESLYISGHLGNTCPGWMMSLHNLRTIFLLGWKECKILPPLRKLPYLENLTLWGMEKAKKVGGEFLGIVDEEDKMLTKSSSSLFFPKLKELKIAYMPALKEWEVGVEGWNKELTICKCSTLSERCEEGSGEEWPKISHISNISISS